MLACKPFPCMVSDSWCGRRPRTFSPIAAGLQLQQNNSSLSSISECAKRVAFQPCGLQRSKRQRAPPTSWVGCRSLSIDAIPADLRIEAKDEDGSSQIEYDEENKVVRIPLSALGPNSQRRTRLVLFTCNKCGGRTARMVNPIAWEKGAVFGQCGKCDVWHVLSVPNKQIFEEVRYNQEVGDQDGNNSNSPTSSSNSSSDSPPPLSEAAMPAQADHPASSH